jgi:hypothetical protein
VAGTRTGVAVSPHSKKTDLSYALGISVLRYTPLFLFLLLSPHPSVAQTPERWHTPPDRWNEPRIYHSPFDKEFDKRVRFSRVPLTESKGEKVFSQNRAYWFSERKPDFTRPGPWTTTLLLFNERSYLIEIQLVDHGSYESKVRWINEKLLYFEMWWGKILGSYFIYDVEKEKSVIQEMIHDGQIPFDQFQEGLKKPIPGKTPR